MTDLSYINENYNAFQELLPDLIKTHAGKYALMRDRKIEEFYDTARDALITGKKQFPDGKFSVQEVTNHIIDLGFFSHVVS